MNISPVFVYPIFCCSPWTPSIQLGLGQQQQTTLNYKIDSRTRINFCINPAN